LRNSCNNVARGGGAINLLGKQTNLKNSVINKSASKAVPPPATQSAALNKTTDAQFYRGTSIKKS